ncbi:hypothetical protein GOP47_0023877 [Adiantum capillus-veneris]|uniref:F-box protein n=1 Tax=Adiantum capillus-veneris TaxID=13818 RepID=A0A9D4Z5K1_ADICA|nr:hypothetical protein GOP47_0023877 [Adiantum capillus-veneris]
MERIEDCRAAGLGSFDVLSDELICRLLELLAAEDLAKLSSVSRVFYIFCNEEPLWMKLCSNNVDGLLKYAGTWRKTVLERLGKKSNHGSSNAKLHVHGFSSLFLYRRWYRCNVNLSSFEINGHMIDRRHGLPLEEFAESYDVKQPLLLCGLAERWPAMQNWSIDYLVEHYGKCVFKVGQNSNKKILMCFEDYAYYMKQQHDEEPLYIFDPKFGEVAPSLVQDYEVPGLFKEDLFDFMDKEDRPPFRWLVIGPARSGASWHVDPALTSAWNTLIRGRKRWALYPPGRVPPSVIVHADEDEGEVDIDSPTSLQWWLDVYPALKDEDKPLECIQFPGETIFVPSGWWHCVLNLDNSLAVTQNFVNTANFELVCLDLSPGFHHKAVARAGRLAMQDHASVVANGPVLEDANKKVHLGPQQPDWSFNLDFLASLVNHHKRHLVSNSVRSDFFLSQSLRKWLLKLWHSRLDLRKQIWKSACVAFDAKCLLERVLSICNMHNLPQPTETEQLPLGNGSNPVFLVGSYVVKLCLDEALEDKALDAVASELQFYSVVKKSGSPLRHVIPEIVASGIVYLEKGSYKAVAWDGQNEPNYEIQKKNSFRSGEFHRARWNQAVLNPSYTDWSEEDVPEGRNTQCPYIVTSKCDGQDLAHSRESMQEEDILSLADILGKHLYNLHNLPLPPMCCSSATGEKQAKPQRKVKPVEFRKDSMYKPPEEWTLFMCMMRRQREHSIARLEEWECVPPHLIRQVEEYLPADPVALVARINGGVPKLSQPAWLHMDITDENLQVVLDPPAGNAQEMQHVLSKEEVNGSVKTCHVLDFGDVCLGDPLYDLVGVYLDVFKGNPDFLKCFLASYHHSFTLNCTESWQSGCHPLELPYRAMCYTILHEENALGAVFGIWKDLRTACTWKEVEEKVWGFLVDYENVWNQIH